MKSNEAPEKIYVHVKRKRVLKEWNSQWIGVNDVEYTRTDAFIEKAEKYLTEKFIKDVSILCMGTVNINFAPAISNFLKYMKGE